MRKFLRLCIFHQAADKAAPAAVFNYFSPFSETRGFHSRTKKGKKLCTNTVMGVSDKKSGQNPEEVEALYPKESWALCKLLTSHNVASLFWRGGAQFGEKLILSHDNSLNNIFRYRNALVNNNQQ